VAASFEDCLNRFGNAMGFALHHPGLYSHGDASHHDSSSSGDYKTVIA